jgi:peptidoglycan-N-acetylglucosamine deacetylase
LKNPLLIQPKKILRHLYRLAFWKINTSEKIIYLTFDDGPIDFTLWILDELKKYSAKATFFCVGANIIKHPKVFERIKAEVHIAANHTMNHVKGYKLSVEEYMNEVEECEALTNNKIFRPPYGQLKRSQYRELLKHDYKIILWDVISYDYEKISSEHCADNVIKNTKAGSIVLFHDSIKAEENVRYALPLFLKHFSGLGYRFESLLNVL